ncbi:glycerol-3-phosphate 1-O-acyltransferase PlsY [Crassaminicella thermophila]|uniref:Glycerol-3-phosphate acyltransferase n=1 Tax=Crassaminicella thermophila TaxID=2599308 RepID=A0A5C0SBI4_CRATE|nr:glycerol-3-phosphate 1-O-acyltransferase PlsY [Crassaminicella thermophila]QEK11975.1 glycerol-3-phosphate 1-O-acyltransferase PlsY [Crassaminicella thermophila]
MLLKTVAVIISYLLGNISTSIILSKFWANIDIRNYGSGNAGTTNVYRTLGAKAAVLTLIGDALKGVFAVWIGSKFGGESLALICGIIVIIGHNWPALFGFKGGKGIATTIGVALTINPLVALICILIAVLILIKTKYVSLASMIGISLLPLLLLFDNGSMHFLFGLVLAGMAIYRHRSNIERLLRGTESKIR